MKKTTAGKTTVRRRIFRDEDEGAEEHWLGGRKPKKESTVRRSDKNRKRQRTRTKTEDQQTLEHLLAHLAIPADGWDYLIVGDGSGTTLDHGCGSASVLIERATMRRTECGCTLSHGTNIMAELFAYVVPLLLMTHDEHKSDARGKRVHIVTDCQHLPMAWQHKHSRKKNRELWRLLESFKRRGLTIAFHWIPRDTWDLNRYCDLVAGLRRKSQLTVSEHALRARNTPSIYDINPITE